LIVKIIVKDKVNDWTKQNYTFAHFKVDHLPCIGCLSLVICYTD